ncbi:MAG: hemolysin III family protein [Propionibacteriaceae bacterium]|jgi:hemolysin III|nr:hemolysin III family protein [Propionibacteriaceae bacterium]
MAEAKPKLRGLLHLGMAPAVLAVGIVFICLAYSVYGKVGAAIYMAGAVLLFGVSALYHRGRWSTRAALVLRRCDHANIFIFIAATYTPMALVLLDDPDRLALLVLIWAVAAAGVATALAWPGAPRWINVIEYLGMGWAGVGWLGSFWLAGGPAVVVLILAGGACYTAGAVVYARKRPDPSPAWFGFHEIFHACTIAAAVCHIVAIGLVIIPAR